MSQTLEVNVKYNNKLWRFPLSDSTTVKQLFHSVAHFTNCNVLENCLVYDGVMLPMGSSLLNQGIKDGAIVEVKKVSEVNMAPIQKDVILPPTAPSSEEAVKEKRKSIRDIFDKRKSLREALKLNMNDLEEQEKRKSITLESPKDGSKSPKDGNKSPKGTADDKKERRKSLKDAILQLLGTTPLDEKALQEKRNSKRLSQKFSDLFSMLKSVPEEQFMQ